MSNAFLLAIDQGTTSTRAMVFEPSGNALAAAQRELSQIFPKPGWVEHDPDVIWRDTEATCREAVKTAGIDVGAIAGIGITNQRETTVLWDRQTGEVCTTLSSGRTGEPVQCATEEQGLEPSCRQDRSVTRSLLPRQRSWLSTTSTALETEAGELACGTIDSFLVWRLTGGDRHVTDATNARHHAVRHSSTTMGRRTAKRLQRTGLASARGARQHRRIRPYRRHAVANHTDPRYGRRSTSGDLGQACLSPGMIKAYGTGCFALSIRAKPRSNRATNYNNDCLSAGKKPPTLQRQHLYRWRGNPMAARRPRYYRRCCETD